MHMAAAQNCLAEPCTRGCSFPASQRVPPQLWGQRGDGEITTAKRLAGIHSPPELGMQLVPSCVLSLGSPVQSPRNLVTR